MNHAGENSNTPGSEVGQSSICRKSEGSPRQCGLGKVLALFGINPSKWRHAFHMIC